MKKKRPFDSASYVSTLAGLVFVVALCLLLWFAVQYALFRPSRSSAPADVSNTSQKIVSCAYRRILDGACVDSPSARNSRYVGVMIENSADAWPLSGVSHASIVFEAPTESNIPRFLAMFPEDAIVEKVGPVRSARPYFLDWFSEFGKSAPYMHVGGSEEALDRIASSAMIDLNEMTHGWYFWRSKDREPPHNAYTSSRLWQKAIAEYGQLFPSSVQQEWVFTTTTESCAEGCVSDIRAVFSLPLYVAEWRYNTSTMAYDRYQVGEKFLDSDSAQVSADTVIIERAQTETIDEVGRKRIQTIGSGKAIVFHDGFALEGTWKKDALERSAAFLDASGNPIPLKGGRIWIEVVPQNGSASWR